MYLVDRSYTTQTLINASTLVLKPLTVLCLNSLDYMIHFSHFSKIILLHSIELERALWGVMGRNRLVDLTVSVRYPNSIR